MTNNKNGERFQNWPIRLKWGDKLSSNWFGRHGWQTGFEVVPVEQTSFGCMPGRRAVFGWTFHIGRLKVCFGRELPELPQGAAVLFAPPRQENA